LAVKTRYGSWVTPKTAGMESRAKRRSVVPMARKTKNSGVTTRRPPSVVVSRLPA
jgi:hypothetical protein